LSVSTETKIKEKDVFIKEMLSEMQRLNNINAMVVQQNTKDNEKKHQLENLKKQIDDLSHSHADSLGKKRELEQTLLSLQAQIEEKDALMQQQHSKIKELNSFTINKDTQFSDLEKDLQQVKHELESSKENFQLEKLDWNKIEESLKIECEALRAALDDQKKEIKQLEENVDEDQAIVLADKIIWHEEHHELLKSELQRTKQTIKVLEEEAKSTQLFLKSELEEARRTIEDQDAAAEILQKHVFELEQEKSIKDQRIEEESFDNYDDYHTPMDMSKLPLKKRALSSIGQSNKKSVNERALRLSAASVLLDNILNREERIIVERAFREWSNSVKTMKAVSQHVEVAETMARQLESTRETLSALKLHLHSNRKKKRGDKE